ncbi:MAG: Gfo/Idh/MocA family oxidoreductase [Opitutaceae bacterium]|jgi:predicted dehydrogenase|nr:Gfo/Idh/MocA family oxidoreductase [Opitutaceae bacterium]
MKTKSAKPKPRRHAPVRVAVIGAGAIGADHLMNFQRHPSAQIVAIAETDPARARAAAETFNVPEIAADWRALPGRDGIDAVSIALPNHLHAEVALAMLRAGKHVLLDKPMATNARDAARLVAEARARGLVLMVGQNNRFLPEVQTARRLIDAGALGDVYHAKTAWMRRAGIPRIGSWFTQKKFAGGGCAYDIGVHALDRCLYLMDEFAAAAVSGQTYAQFGPRGEGDGAWGKSEIDPSRPFDVDDLCVALIKLKSGRTVLLEASWAAHQAEPDVNGTQVFGAKAGLSLPPLKLFKNSKTGYTTELVNTSCGAPGDNRMTHFVDCVLGRAEPFVKPEESLAVQKILDAIYASAASGREIRLK